MERKDVAAPKLDRRRFLGLVGAGAVSVLTGGLTGCGGGGGRGSIPIRNISEEDRAASLDAIEAFMNSVAAQALDDQKTAALNFITNRPEFITFGATADGVWAIYPDGVPLTILCNRRPDHVTFSGVRFPWIPIEVPSQTQVRLINAMGNAFFDETPMVDALVSQNGYSTINDPGTVESLKTVSGDGVFYMSTHGGDCSLPTLDLNGNFVRGPGGGILVHHEFGVWTSTVASPATVEPFMPDIRAQRLGIGMALHSLGPNDEEVYERHYWFTRRFVDDYMSFGTNSLVWFSCCKGNSTLSPFFVQSCIAKGAGVYVGWIRNVNSDECLRAGGFIIDRILGTNILNPQEAPPQRPFDFVQVWDDLPQVRIDPTDIKYTVGTAFGMLAPTLAYVLIDEFDDEAVLYGVFGNPNPSERIVTIDGTEVTVKSWKYDEIHVDLPRSGPGSSGDVLVQVRGHKSNVRQITEWNAHMNYAWRETALPPLVVAGPIDVRFRADVATYRTQPGHLPISPIRWALGTRESSANLTASGTAMDGTCSNTWSGNGVFLAGGFQSPPDRMIVARMKIDTQLGTGDIGLAYGYVSGSPFSWEVTCDGGGSNVVPLPISFGLLDGTVDFHTPNPDPNDPAVPLPSLSFQFGADYSIPARNFVDASPDPIHIELTWNEIVPTSPPDPDAARIAQRNPGAKGTKKGG